MAQKVSIIIPNYNGVSLLKNNLPKVIANCPKSEIIVVDDASKDNSVEFIKKNFKSVKVLVNKKNLGFGQTVNYGVSKAKGDLVLLLNSDVAPREGFLEPALAHFTRQNLFAVGLCDFSHEDGTVVKRGRGGAKFKKGFLRHYAAEIKPGQTLWVSGGSGLFDKKKFRELCGFDPLFAPFYWEDIDLSFCAQKKGYICIFEPESRVDHFHEEGAIKKTSTRYFVKIVSYRNQFLFVWKNISHPIFLISHILWLPYHLLNSTIRRDTAFIIGFLWAIAKLPNLIFKPHCPGQEKVTDWEVIKKFEKS